MHEVTQTALEKVLRQLDIHARDGLLVHSALQFLGRPAGGIDLYLKALQSVLGTQGTIAVPAFSFSFGEGKPFDRQKTPSTGMGVFSEFVRQRPGAMRTTHPMQSLAISGAGAVDLARRDTPGAFDPGSAFERMLEMEYKLLLLGADVQAVSMVHYSEQRASVPYRYWKEFRGLWRDGAFAEERTYRMFVRNLEIDPQLVLRPVQDALQAQGMWREQPLGYGKVCTCRLVDFVNAADHLLAENPWALVGNRTGADRQP